jgi:cellobiose transport system substrate-binding protein
MVNVNTVRALSQLYVERSFGVPVHAHKGVTVRISRRKTAIAVAGATVLALVATGCSSGSDSAEGGDIELTVTTFGTMGLGDLYAEYEESHPGITIKATNIDTGDNARTDAFTKLAAGSGLADVQAIEEGWLGAIMEVSDQFVDLNDYNGEEVAPTLTDYKLAQGTDPDGRVIGYGTDIAPEGLCYNSTLFAEAGLPSDREGVAELFGGDDATWEKYFEIGTQYNEKTGKAWYDHSGFVWNAMVNQLDEGYYTPDGELNIDGNDEMKSLFTLLADGSTSGLSDNQTAWDWGGGQAFTDGSFATFVCPAWMLGVVKGQVEAGGGDASTGWDFANVFPGGAANWGGSFLTVPTQSKHPEEAAELAAWLVEAPQQVKAFQSAGTFPAAVSAQSDPGVTGESELTKFYNNAPIGEILAERSVGVTAQFKGPDDSVIQSQVFGPPLKSIDAGEATGDEAWSDALDLLKQLDIE